MATERHEPLYLAIDFGTSVTVAAGMRSGGEPEVVRLDSDDPAGIYMPSAVYRAHDGEIWVGRAAVEAIVADPLGGQLTPKTAIGSGMEVETLAGRPVPLVGLIARVLARAHSAAIAQFGGDEPVAVTLTCPVAWAPDGPYAVRRRVLRAAAQLAAIPAEISVLNEAEAAAHHHGGGELPIDEGELCSVYDIGGGTCDIAILRRDQGRLTVVSLAEAEVGGDLFDWLLYEHVVNGLERGRPDAAAALRLAAAGGDDAAWRRRQVALAAAVRHAKERLSDEDRAQVEFPEGVADTVVVTRETLERLVRPDVEATGDELRTCVRRGLEGGGDHRGLRACYMVGGASRTPLVRDVVHAATGLEPQTVEDPRTAVALGAVQALEARRGVRPRRRARRGEELHARLLLGCAAHQRHAFLAHLDAAGVPTLTRLDLRRGAADRSVDLPGVNEDEPLTVAAHAAGVAAATPRSVLVRDLDLEPVLGLEPGSGFDGEVLHAEVGPTCVWVVYAEPAGPDGRRGRRRLRLRTVGVPNAERAEALVRDVGIGDHVAAPSPGGPPPFWAVGSGVPGRHELLLAVQTRGLTGVEQQIFAAAEDGRMRKVQTRSAAPWLLDRRLTAAGELWLETEPAAGVHRLHAHLGAAHLLTAESESPGGVHAVSLVTPGALYLALGSTAGPPWELFRVDVSRRSESDRQLAGIHLEATVEPSWSTPHRRGLFRVHRDNRSRLVAGRASVQAENGAWVSIHGSGASAVVRVDAVGVRAQVPVPIGALPVGSGAGRVYVRTPAAGTDAGTDLRSVPWDPPAAS